MNNDLELGCEAVDKVTGWRGIAIAYSVELGCVEQWKIQKRELSTDGQTQEQWFTAARLQVVAGGAVKLDEPTKVRRVAGFARDS